MIVDISRWVVSERIKQIIHLPEFPVLFSSITSLELLLNFSVFIFFLRVLHANIFWIIVNGLKSSLQILYCIRMTEFIFNNTCSAHTFPASNQKKSASFSNGWLLKKQSRLFGLKKCKVLLLQKELFYNQFCWVRVMMLSEKHLYDKIFYTFWVIKK